MRKTHETDVPATSSAVGGCELIGFTLQPEKQLWTVLSVLVIVGPPCESLRVHL